MRPNPQFPADLVTFTVEILNGKLHFLCRVVLPPFLEMYSFSFFLFFFINNQKYKQPGWNWPKAKQLAKQPLSLRETSQQYFSHCYFNAPINCIWGMPQGELAPLCTPAIQKRKTKQNRKHPQGSFNEHKIESCWKNDYF